MISEKDKYAGFWRRWAAYTLDTAFICYVVNAFYWFIYNQSDTLHMLYWIPTNQREIAQVTSGVFSFSFAWAYFAGMESSPLKGTLGKLAAGIFVVDENGEQISFGQATGRFFGKIISALILYIGFIIAGWTRRKQALHDMMASTLVLRK